MKEPSAADVVLAKLGADAMALIRKLLCSFASMVSAVDSWSVSRPDFSRGRGALRLAWDLVMTGKARVRGAA